jgi:hypothetical protein
MQMQILAGDGLNQAKKQHLAPRLLSLFKVSFFIELGPYYGA